MTRLLITGGSGYIGRRLCELAAERGYDVIALGHASSAGNKVTRVITWRLEENPIPEAFEGVAAVIHLAHVWTSGSQDGTSQANINLSGSERLARAALTAGVPRFVFASTTSARPQALNDYGRVKYATEERLKALPEAAGRVFCARIGLVYGGQEAGLYGILSRLVRLTPLLPMVGLDRKVQPIYLDEVVAGLLSLAALRRRDDATATFVLAGPDPIPFGKWLQMLRRAHTGKKMFFLPLQLWMLLLACHITRHLPFVPTIDRERVLGLIGTVPMDSRADLATLGVDVIAPMRRLASFRSERRRMIAEALAMLSYVSGQHDPPKAAVARLVRGIIHLGVGSLGLPRVVINCPTLLRIFEPLPPNLTHALGQRLHLAAMVMESMQGQLAPRPSLRIILVQAFLEAITMPLRLVFGRYYA